MRIFDTLRAARTGPKPRSDEALLADVAKGDVSALEELHRKYFPKLMHFARRITDNAESAEPGRRVRRPSDRGFQKCVQNIGHAWIARRCAKAGGLQTRQTFRIEFQIGLFHHATDQPVTTAEVIVDRCVARANTKRDLADRDLVQRFCLDQQLSRGIKNGFGG